MENPARDDDAYDQDVDGEAFDGPPDEVPQAKDEAQDDFEGDDDDDSA